MTKVVLKLIEFYQKVISKYIIRGNHCRFIPSCSEYSRQAYLKYGFFKGTLLTVKRLLKCHPFGESGYDPLV